jgi:hypothetical protein
MPAPPPSSRLVRAVAAERDELERHRARMAEEAEELRRALGRIERGLAEIDERRALLDRVAPVAPPTPPPSTPADTSLLRGPEIREAAVRVLVEHGPGDALHYRAWFDLLAQHGHAIAGKDPLAVFLTQLGRSPAVRKGARAGVYELDRHAGARLRATLERLQRELRELTTAPGTDLRAVRARREQLSAEIGRVERALEETARVLGPAPPLTAISTSTSA